MFPRLPSNNLHINSSREDYSRYESNLYEGLIDQKQFDELVQDVNYLHKDEYIRAYTKCLLQFIEELTAHYDPTPDLINKNLEQEQIDLSFNIAKANINEVYDKSLSFICQIIHIRAFDFAFIRYSNNRKKMDKLRFRQVITNKNDEVCWCPCNKHFERWRNVCGFENYVDKPCEDIPYNIQGLIKHLASHGLDDCRVHRLLYLYIYYLHDGKKDRRLVSKNFTSTFTKHCKIDLMIRYVLILYYCCNNTQKRKEDSMNPPYIPATQQGPQKHFHMWDFLWEHVPKY